MDESLFFREHSTNKIHWKQYGPEALQQAKDENKPIFMSIGYASCHWCQVMNRDVFNNDEVADILNENFINILVDREECPDIDNYYQMAAQLYSQVGGWPLNVFLLPDTRPYFAGTFYSLHSTDEKHLGFLDLIKEMTKVFKDDRKLVEDNAEKITQAIIKGLVPKDKVEFEGHFPHPMAILKAIEQFKNKEHGGYGDAPRFPNFSLYTFLIEQILEGVIDREEGQFVVDSLNKMLMGGIVDHAKGGIHRYCSDNSWHQPHFEKMLYDQAGLIRMLSKLTIIYPAPIVFETLIKALNFLDTEMLSEHGYFHASENSDTEEGEGLYYTYTKTEFEDALNSADDDEETLAKNMDKLLKWFDIKDEGNYDGPLNVISFNPEFVKEFYTQESWPIVQKALKAICEDRKDRIPPTIDTKGVASWNFMLASALLDVMQYVNIDAVKFKANEIFNKILTGTFNAFVVSNQGGKMMIRHTTTKPQNVPLLEDYATFAELQLRTYELTGNDVFKSNFKQTLTYMHQVFVQDDKILTRSLESQDAEEYPNLEVGAFDNSYRSPASMLIELTRRAKVLFKDNELMDPINKAKEAIIHEALKNPIVSGEALHALTYPDEVYRVLSVPRAWAKEAKFLQLIRGFLSRFVIDYHDNGDSWEICSCESCELKGEGLDNLVETINPKKPEGEQVQ